MELKLRHKKQIEDILLFVLAGLSMFLFLWRYRFAVNACSDSVAEFVLAEVTGSRTGYDRTVVFQHSRGRLNILFPYLIQFRYYLHSLKSYFWTWAAQYVPIILNVLLIAGVIAKKIGYRIACIFVTFFFCFCQVNVWHSLIICYPIEFMVGLLMGLLGLITFDIATNTSKKLPKILLYAISLQLYYESMYTYESFILFAAVYFWITLCKVISMDKKEGLAKVKNILRKIGILVLTLIPHAFTALDFLLVRSYVSSHPEQFDIPYIDDVVMTFGTVPHAIKTWFIFTFSMFPLSTIPVLIHHGEFSNLIQFMDKKSVLMGILYLVIGAVIGYVLLDVIRKFDRKMRIKILAFSGAGFMLAVTFTLLHAISEKYQIWVLYGGQYGYLPSSISYFGWIAFLVPVIVVLLSLIPQKKQIAVIIITSVLFGMGGFFTTAINNRYDTVNGGSSVIYSYRSQAFYALAHSSVYYSDLPEALFLPNSAGVHGFFMPHELLSNTMSGEKSVHITNVYPEDIEAFIEVGRDTAGFLYITDTMGVYVRDIAAEESDAYLVTMHGGTYTLKNGDTITLDSNETYKLPYRLNWSELVATYEF